MAVAAQLSGVGNGGEVFLSDGAAEITAPVAVLDLHQRGRGEKRRRSSRVPLMQNDRYAPHRGMHESAIAQRCADRAIYSTAVWNTQGSRSEGFHRRAVGCVPQDVDIYKYK